jgi:hypothetical protein
VGALLAAGVGQDSDHGADSGAGFKQALAHQMGNDLVRCIGIDLEFFAQGADGGERVTGAQLAGDHGFFRRVDDLLEERDAGAEVDAERNHMCTMTVSTLNCKKKILESWLCFDAQP